MYKNAKKHKEKAKKINVGGFNSKDISAPDVILMRFYSFTKK